MADSNPEPTASSSQEGLWARFRRIYARDPYEGQQHVAEEGRSTAEPSMDDRVKRRTDQFTYYDKYDEIPKGWPSYSHDQNYLHNRSYHRRFGPLSQRLLHDYEVRLYLIDNEILDLDKADERSNSKTLRGLSPAQRRDSEGQTERSAKKTELIREGQEILPKYHELLLLDNKMRGLIRISRREHLSFYRAIEKHNVLDETARKYLQHPDDFITTRSRRAHESLEWLIYGKHRLNKFLRKPFLFKNHPKGKRNIKSSRLMIIPVFVMMALTLGLLMTPMLIIFLMDLRRWQSALVVFLFCATSATGVSTRRYAKLDTVFIVVSAYMAVQVSLLGNLENGQSQCCR